MTGPDLSAWFAVEGPADPLAERILDAAAEEFLRFGLRRARMEDIVRRAGVGRITVYRRFENKAGLVRATVWREVRRLLGELEPVLTGAPTPALMIEGWVIALRAVHENSLLNALLNVEPESVLPLLTIEADDVFTLGRGIVAGQIQRWQAAGLLDEFDPEPVAEVSMRIVHSLALTRETVIPLDTDDDRRAFVRRFILPLLAAEMTEANRPH